MAFDTQGLTEVGMERRSSGTSPSITSPPASIRSGSRSHFSSFITLKRGKYFGGSFSLDEFVQLRPSCGLTKLSTDLHELFITIGQALENELNANAEEIIHSCFKLDDSSDGIEFALNIISRLIGEVEVKPCFKEKSSAIHSAELSLKCFSFAFAFAFAFGFGFGFGFFTTIRYFSSYYLLVGVPISSKELQCLIQLTDFQFSSNLLHQYYM